MKKINTIVKALCSFALLFSLGTAAWSETKNLSLNNGRLDIYPTGYSQGVALNKISKDSTPVNQYTGDYYITGECHADWPMAIRNYTGQKATFNVTLDNATIYGNQWCSAFVVVGNADIDLYLNVIGKSKISADNHGPIQLQSGITLYINVAETEGSSFTLESRSGSHLKYEVAGSNSTGGKIIFQKGDKILDETGQVVATANWEFNVDGNKLNATKYPTSTDLVLTTLDNLSAPLSEFNTKTGLVATYKKAGYLVGENIVSDIPSEAGLYQEKVVVTVLENDYELTLPTKLLVLDENIDNRNAITLAAQETSVDVAVSRTFGVNNNSLCLPFTLTSNEVSALFGRSKIYLPTTAAANTETSAKLTVAPIQTMAAGRGYIINLASPITWNKKLFKNKVIVASPVDSALTGLNVKGTYAPVTLTAGDKNNFYIKAGGKGFSYPKANDNTNIRAFRIYFQHPTEE